MWALAASIEASILRTELVLRYRRGRPAHCMVDLWCYVEQEARYRALSNADKHSGPHQPTPCAHQSRTQCVNPTKDIHATVQSREENIHSGPRASFNQSATQDTPHVLHSSTQVRACMKRHPPSFSCSPTEAKKSPHESIERPCK